MIAFIVIIRDRMGAVRFVCGPFLDRAEAHRIKYALGGLQNGAEVRIISRELSFENGAGI